MHLCYNVTLLVRLHVYILNEIFSGSPLHEDVKFLQHLGKQPLPHLRSALDAR